MSGIVPVHWKEFERFLGSLGCVLVREKGDHRIWIKNGLARPVVVPKKRAIPVFVIKNNLRVLGVSVFAYLETMRH